MGLFVILKTMNQSEHSASAIFDKQKNDQRERILKMLKQAKTLLQHPRVETGSGNVHLQTAQALAETPNNPKAVDRVALTVSEEQQQLEALQASQPPEFSHQDAVAWLSVPAGKDAQEAFFRQLGFDKHQLARRKGSEVRQYSFNEFVDRMVSFKSHFDSDHGLAGSVNLAPNIDLKGGSEPFWVVLSTEIGRQAAERAKANQLDFSSETFQQLMSLTIDEQRSRLQKHDWTSEGVLRSRRSQSEYQPGDVINRILITLQSAPALASMNDEGFQQHLQQAVSNLPDLQFRNGQLLRDNFRAALTQFRQERLARSSST